jgi:hypothetical protein
LNAVFQNNPNSSIPTKKSTKKKIHKKKLKVLACMPMCMAGADAPPPTMESIGEMAGQLKGAGVEVCYNVEIKLRLSIMFI